MNLFIRKLIFFFLPIVLLSFPLDYFLSSQLKKSRNYAQHEFSVWNDLFEGKVNSDIVIYGSSRAWVHIDPQIIENILNVSAYNLGIDGHNFWLQYLRHEVLLEFNSAPKEIILSVDMFSLEKRRDLYNADQFLPYMLYNDLLKNYIKSYQGYNSFDYNLPILRFYGNGTAIYNSIKNFIFSPNGLEGRKRGYLGIEKKWNNDLRKAKTDLIYYEVNLDPQSVKLFEEFLIDCDERNINIILVYTPEYIEGQDFVRNRNDIILLYKYFSNKYSIQFLDYSNDEMCFNKKNFYNSSHLNKIGATIFTNKLIGDLDSIYNQ
jgi:hypothetical protein